MVESVEGGRAEIRYLVTDVALTVQHHADLPVVVGGAVRVHEQFRMLGTPAGWCAVMMHGGLGPIPEPGSPETWAAETVPGIVHLDTGDAVAADHHQDRQR